MTRLPKSDVIDVSYVRAIKFNTDTIERTFTIANNHIVHQFEYKMPLNRSVTMSYYKLKRKYNLEFEEFNLGQHVYLRD